MVTSSLIYVGIKGCVVALDRATGTQVWLASLRGSEFVNVFLGDTDLYAATKGELFCLDPATGHIRWRNPLRGLGWGLVSIAAPCIQFNQTPMFEQRKREQEAAAAAAASA